MHSNAQLLDTNIIIDANRGLSTAADFINSLKANAYISNFTFLELMAGARDKKQLQIIYREVPKLFYILSISRAVEELATELLYKYRLTNGLNTIDSFLAATGLIYDIPLVTRNTKHFKFIPGLKLINPY